MHISKTVASAIGVTVAMLRPSHAETPVKPQIIVRSDWGAQLPTFEMQSQFPSRITVHHTATLQVPKGDIRSKLQSLQSFSQSSGKLADGRKKVPWADVPYHFYIDVSGDIAEGRDIFMSGDTNTPYDTQGHIAIVIEGNFEIEKPTLAQTLSLEELIVHLVGVYSIPPSQISGHNAFVSTACPGENLAQFVRDIGARVGSKDSASAVSEGAQKN